MSSTTNQTWYFDILRSAVAMIDSIGYALLAFVYKIFYVVANSTIITGDVVKTFYSRIQLILGILMVFKLSMTILTIIINPDSVKDQKSGPGKIVIRVVMSLFMLTLVVPISIPDAKSGSINQYINDHGILFGYLYKFQDSMMKENIIGKLVLGTTVDASDNNGDINNLSDVGGSMAATVVRAFMRPNRTDPNDNSKPYCYTSKEEAAKYGDTYDENEPCPNVLCPEEVYNSGYTRNRSADDLLNYVNETCEDRYAFVYTPILGLLTSGIMAFIIVGFIIDIAIRSIKLAILRLVAPIPIISYIDPKSEKDGAFGNWTKTLISTYIDLFLRLAIVYFAALLVQIVASGGIDIISSSGDIVVDTLSVVAIIIGILFFAKQAPKFFKDMLGLKGTMGNVGLSGMLGGAAMAIGGGGLSGFALGAMQGMNTSAEATAQGKSFGPGQAWAQNRDQMAKIRTGDKDARGGIVGRTMDRALYNTRERQLARRGLTSENAELAKDEFYKQQDVVHAAQTARDLAYEKVKNLGGDPTNVPEPVLIEPTPHEYGGYTREFEIARREAKKDYERQVQNRAAQEKAWKDFQTKDRTLGEEQTILAKKEKNMKKIGEMRSASGVDPRQIDEYTPAGYRAGAHHARFNPYQDFRRAGSEPAGNVDDTGRDRFGGEIGGSPGTGPGGPHFH